MKRVVLLALVASSGCGAGLSAAFSPHFHDNQPDELAGVLARLPAAAPATRPENATGEPILVATTHADDPAARQIIAYRLPGGESLWSVPLDASTRPEVLGDVVMTTHREDLVALDLATGRQLWSAPLSDLAYVGAAREGDTIYFAATVGALGGARRVGRLVAVDARSGDRKWNYDISGVFGEPVATGGLVLVPWERQNIAILDGETGIELTRLRSTDDVVAWMLGDSTGVYYGSRGIYRLDDRSASGERAQSTYLPAAVGDLPRQPETIAEDGFVPRPGARSARGRIRVYFRPSAAPAHQLGVLGDRWYFVFYRYVMAYDNEGRLLWTRILEQDVINAEPLANGLLAVGEQGSLRLLDRETGNDRWQASLDAQLASVAIDAAGFDPPGEAGAARPLRTSLNELVLDPDNRLVAARSYAIGQLAAIAEPDVTRDLLDLYQQRSMPGTLKEAIREALRARTSGVEHLLAALDRRYDYLEDTQAPPLEAIVPALLQMNAAQSVPRLINHMMDHETPDDVLPLVVRAVVELGGADAIPALRTFLVLYHSDSSFEGPVEDGRSPQNEVIHASPTARALAEAAQGIFDAGGPEGRELLVRLGQPHARTHAPLVAYAEALVRAELEAQERQRQQEAAAAQQALADAARQAQAALPARLSREQINQTFAENADTLRECVAGELERNPRLMQVRLVFILENDGHANDVTVAPNTAELVTCLQERVATIEFPHFRQRRMRADFTVSIRGAGGEEPVEGTEPAAHALAQDAPWWAWSRWRAERSGLAAMPDVPAWWTARDAPAEPVAVTQLPQAQPETQAQTPEAPTETGTPWWANTGAEEEEEAPPPPPPEPAPRGRPRGRGRAQPAPQQPAPQQPAPQQPAPQQPAPQQPAPQQPAPQQPAPQQPAPQQPAPRPAPQPPAQPENPWWQGAE